MNTKETTNEYRMAQWGQIFTNRVAKANIDEFCERNGISRNQYFYWQKKLREAACNEFFSKEDNLNPPVPSG